MRTKLKPSPMVCSNKRGIFSLWNPQIKLNIHAIYAKNVAKGYKKKHTYQYSEQQFQACNSSTKTRTPRHVRPLSWCAVAMGSLQSDRKDTELILNSFTSFYTPYKMIFSMQKQCNKFSTNSLFLVTVKTLLNTSLVVQDKKAIFVSGLSSGLFQ